MRLQRQCWFLGRVTLSEVTGTPLEIPTQDHATMHFYYLQNTSLNSVNRFRVQILVQRFFQSHKISLFQGNGRIKISGRWKHRDMQGEESQKELAKGKRNVKGIQRVSYCTPIEQHSNSLFSSILFFQRPLCQLSLLHMKNTWGPEVLPHGSNILKDLEVAP